MKPLIIIFFILISLTSFGQGSKYTVKGNGSGGSNVGDSVKKNTDTLVIHNIRIIKNTDTLVSHNTRIGKNNDSLISHNTRIGANTTNIASNAASIAGKGDSTAFMHKAYNITETITGGKLNTGITSITQNPDSLDPQRLRSQQYATDGSRPGLLQIRYGDYTRGSGLEIYGFGTNTGPFLHFNQAGGSDTTPTQTLAGRVIGGIASRGKLNALGYSGSTAGWHMYANENFTSTAQGTYQEFFNVLTGSQTRRINMRLRDDGTTNFNYAIGAQGIADTGTLTVSGLTTLSAGLTEFGAVDFSAENITLGSVTGGSLRTNATSKVFRILTYPYTNANPASVSMIGLSNATDNITYLNGGSGASNAGTILNIYAAANNNTLGGTNVGNVRLGGWRIGDATAATSTLQVIGSFAPSYIAKATSYTATISDCVIEVTATGQTITLPTAVGIQGRQYTVKLTASGSGTVNTTSSQTIDGSTTYSLSAQYKYVTVQSNNTNWIVIANN